METGFFFTNRNKYVKIFSSVQISSKWFYFAMLYIVLFSYNAAFVKFGFGKYYPIYIFMILMYISPILLIFYGLLVLRKFIYSAKFNIILDNKKLIFTEEKITVYYPDGSSYPIEEYDIYRISRYKSYYLIYMDSTFFIPIDEKYFNFPPDKLFDIYPQKHNFFK